MKKIITFMLALLLLIGAVLGGSETAYAAEGKSVDDVRTSNTEAVKQAYDAVAALEAGKQEKRPAAGWEADETTDDSASNSFVKMQAGNSCGTHLTWNLSGGTLTISGTGAMTNYDDTSRPGWESQKSRITSVDIKSGVTSIGEMAFYGCYNLESVTIPDSVSAIGDAAFFECGSLTSVTIPSAVRTLPEGVFANCSSLKQVTCSGVTSIKDYAFQGTPLENFTVPQGLTAISGLAFFNAPVKAYAVASGNPVFSAEGGVLYADGGKTLFLYPAGKTDTSFTVPSRVTKIGKAAMANTGYLRSVSFAGAVKELGESAFQDAGLTSIVIPDSVTKAGYFTFYECSELESVTFGSGLTASSYQMFEKCEKLRTIQFGIALRTLGAQTFAYCSSLTSVTLPVSIKELETGVFGECRELKTFQSKGLKKIPFQTFVNCSKLSSVTLNEGVTDIYRASFLGCDTLKNITLPKSVKYVHSIAFPKTTAIKCKDSGMQKFGVNGYRYLNKVSLTGTRDYKKAYEVLTIVNQQRAKAGLGNLTMNKNLLESAMKRAAECAVCFSHTRPDGSICFDLDSAMCAENVAAGQATAKSVMNSWMNSAGHKANILLKDAKCIGIGCFTNNGVTYWVQCFGTAKGSSCSRPRNCSKTQTVALAAEEFQEAENGTGVVFSQGKPTTYSYKYKVKLSKSKIKMKETAKARLMVRNAGFQSAYALLDSTGVTWKTSSKSLAKVNSSGKITGVRKGTAIITAKIKHNSASGKIKIDYDSKTLKKVKAVQKKLPKGTVSKLKKSKKRSVKVTCKKVKSVGGYQVRIASNKKMKSAKTYAVKNRQATIKNLKKGKRYYIQVRVYKTVSGMKIYGKWGKTKQVKF